ncbi:MAG: PAS domain-containing sensor histidine kinase [Aggregatilineales bacterium]
MSRLMDVPEQKSWQKQLLMQTLWFTLVMNIVNMILVFVQGIDYTYWIDIVLLGVQFGLVWIARRGYHRASAIVLVITIWLFLTTGINDYTSITSPFFTAYLILVLVAGLILGGKVAAITAVASICVGFISLLDHRTSEAEGILLYMSATMLVSAYLLDKMTTEIHNAFSSVHDKNTVLETTNQHLNDEITERHKVEATLKESESRYRNLIDFASVCMVVNNLEGKIVYANPYAAKIFGVQDEQELIGKSSWDFFTPDTTELMRQRMSLVKQGKQTPVVAFEIKTFDERIISIEVSSMPIDYEGEPAVLGIINDVTARKVAQDARMETERLSMALEKERQFGQLRDDFITMMSHEFRTPLSIIHSSKDLLQRYAERMSAEKQALHFEKIGTQVTHMVDMLDGMLTLSQATAGILPFTPKPNNLNAICREVFETYQDEDRMHHKMQFRAETNTQQALFDEKMLRGIVANLLLDAQHFTPAGGAIHMETRSDEGTFILTIADDGQPVSDEAKAHLFQPFFYHDDPLLSRGTGLSLAIVQEFVEAHDGKITCENGAEGGIVYTVELPLKLATYAHEFQTV